MPTQFPVAPRACASFGAMPRHRAGRAEPPEAAVAAVLAGGRTHGCPLDRCSIKRTLECLCHTSAELVLPTTFASCCDRRRPMRYGVWGRDDAAWEQTIRRSYERVAARVNACAAAGVAGKSSQVTPVAGDRESDFGPIPHILHHIWLGPPCPRTVQEWMREWQLRHPGWRHILWDDTAVAEFGLANEVAYHAAPNYGEKSDIARYEILERLGGVYLDADMECVRCLAPLHAARNQCGFYAGASNTGTVEINNALIGARPGHPILRECVRRIAAKAKERAAVEAKHRQLGALFALSSSGGEGVDFSSVLDKKVEAMFPTLECTGPGLFTRVVMQALHAQEVTAEEEGRADEKPPSPPKPGVVLQRSAARTCGDCGMGGGDDDGGEGSGCGRGADSGGDEVWVLPPSFFYPMPNSSREAEPLRSHGRRRDAQRWAQPESFAVHHWACSWTTTTAAAADKASADTSTGDTATADTAPAATRSSWTPSKWT